MILNHSEPGLSVQLLEMHTKCLSPLGKIQHAPILCRLALQIEKPTFSVGQRNILTFSSAIWLLRHDNDASDATVQAGLTCKHRCTQCPGQAGGHQATLEFPLHKETGGERAQSVQIHWQENSQICPSNFEDYLSLFSPFSQVKIGFRAFDKFYNSLWCYFMVIKLIGIALSYL